MSRSILVILSLAAAVLAGCVAGNDDGRDGRPLFDADSGGIHGTVLNEDLLPVGRAEAAIPNLGLSTTTNGEGRFVFSHVEPGTHTLYVIRVGFELFEQEVTVAAGRVAEVDARLVAVAITEPFQVTQTQRGLFGCGASWAPGIPPEPGPGLGDVPGTAGLPHRIGGLAGCGVLSDDDFSDTPLADFDEFLLRWDVDVGLSTEDWMSSVFEMEWTTNQLAGRGLSMTWEVNDCVNRPAFQFSREDGQSPLRGVADHASIQSIIANGTLEADNCSAAMSNCNDERCTIMSRVFAVRETTGSDEFDIGISFQQTYDMYHTFFYLRPAPEGFSALAEQ